MWTKNYYFRFLIRVQDDEVWVEIVYSKQASKLRKSAFFRMVQTSHKIPYGNIMKVWHWNLLLIKSLVLLYSAYTQRTCCHVTWRLWTRFIRWIEFQGCIQFNVDQALTECYSLLKGQFQRQSSFRLFGWRVIS
jgi:hypothetical protein